MIFDRAFYRAGVLGGNCPLRSYRFRRNFFFILLSLILFSGYLRFYFPSFLGGGFFLFLGPALFIQEFDPFIHLARSVHAVSGKDQFHGFNLIICRADRKDKDRIGVLRRFDAVFDNRVKGNVFCSDFEFLFLRIDKEDPSVRQVCMEIKFFYGNV